MGHVGRKCTGARSQLLMQEGQLGRTKMEVSMAVMRIDEDANHGGNKTIFNSSLTFGQL